jgi:hypothetical protein
LNAGQGLSQRLLLPVRTGVGADDPAPRAHHPRRERRHRVLIAFANAQPGLVDYAFVPGTGGHITTELFVHRRNQNHARAASKRLISCRTESASLRPSRSIMTLLSPLGLERKVILQGVHQLTSSDLGELRRAEEARASTLS